MPDFSGLRYLTAPNHIQSDKASKAPGVQNGGNMYQMRADDHRCCQHNFGHAWPNFVQYQWMATGDNGLAAVFYAPSSVTASVASDPFAISIDTALPILNRLAGSASRPCPRDTGETPRSRAHARDRPREGARP